MPSLAGSAYLMNAAVNARQPHAEHHGKAVDLVL